MDQTPSSPAPTQTDAWVVIAGCDTWAHLRALAAYARVHPEGCVFVFRAPEIAGAADTVEVIRRFSSRCWPRLRLIVPGASGANTAASIEAQIVDWKHFHPELTLWQVDATDATGPVLDGLARAAAGDPRMRVIMRERDGAWQVAAGGGKGRLTFGPMAPPISPDSLDATSLVDLLSPFCGAAAEVLWRESREAERLSAAELASLVVAGAKSNWAWRTMYESALGRPCRQAEYGLKDFLASALLAMGVTNVRLDVRITWTERKEEPLSLDVVACRHGRIFLFDCQTGGEDRAEGVRAATQAAARQLLGRMEAACVVLRPTRWATGAERVMELAAPAAHLLDVDACRTLFTRLASVLGASVPPELRALERGALRFNATRLPVLTAASSAQRLGDAVHVDDRIFDLVKGARVDESNTGAVWRAARVTPDTWFIEGRLASGGPPLEMRQRLEARFVAERVRASVVFFELSPNRRYWHAVLRVTGEPSAFSRWLHAWRKLPLIV